MSGTKAHAIRQAEEQAAALALAQNHNQAQTLLLDLLMEINGWAELDSWLTSTIAAIQANETIDLDALEQSITDWKTTQSEESDETTTGTEE